MSKLRSVFTSRSLVLLVGFLALTFLGACGDDEQSDSTCTVTSECSPGEICHLGSCQPTGQARPCTGPAECLAGEACVLGYCAVEETSVPDTMDPETTDPGDVTTAPDSTEPDVLDQIAPTVESHTPAADAAGVALNTTVTATFSETLIQASVIDTRNFFVKDSDNKTVPGTVTWDEASLTVTLTFTEPLWPWSTYRATLTSGVMDPSQNSLVEYSWDFSTAAPPAQTFYAELARAYAPIFHANANDVKNDVPVRIDFDGDLQPHNNRDNMGTGAYDPAIYFNVTETETHYFVHYVLYFPLYMATSNSATWLEHTVNGVLVQIAKDGTRHGHLELVQTHSSGFADGRVDTFVPDCAAAAGEPFCPHTFEEVQTINNYYHKVPAAEFADATDHRRVGIFINSFDHEVCHFASNGEGNIYCAHTPNSYVETDYAELTLHPDMTGTPEPADFVTAHTGTYQLYPLAEPWWTMRGSMSSTDTTAFYRSDYAYDAPNTQQPSVAGLSLPNALATDEQTGNTGMYSPWGWSASDGYGVDKGVWTVDPAYAVQRRVVVPAEFTYEAANYCFNAFMGIDRTQTDDLCKPAN